MSGPFFVAGLPRSRTAWLANFLTYDGRYCHHEAADGCHSMDEYAEKVGDDGDSGTGLMMLDINSRFPGAPALVIAPDIDRIHRSLTAIFGRCQMEELEYLAQLLRQMDGMVVKVQDIDESLEKIWLHLIGTPYDRRRGEMLAKMNVQVNDPYNYDVIAAKALLANAGERQWLG